MLYSKNKIYFIDSEILFHKMKMLQYLLQAVLFKREAMYTIPLAGQVFTTFYRCSSDL